MRNSDTLPSCQDYSNFLIKAVFNFHIDINTARSKYGKFTYKQWNELFNNQ